MTEEEAKTLILDSILAVKAQTGWGDGQIAELLSEITHAFDHFENLYQPDTELMNRLQDYIAWYAEWEEATQIGNASRLKTLDREAGPLLEEIAFLAFRCLKGFDSIKSFQSYAAQYDLLISGSTPAWFMLMHLLHLPEATRTIIVEVKNTKEPVSDAQFSRLCSIMHHKLDNTCSLGIFFTRSGATGFPSSSRKLRYRALRDSRATQVIFHAKTKKFVLVLDHSELSQLAKKGALPRILEAKVKDVEEASGLSLEFSEEWIEIDLPSHLARYANDNF